MREEGNQTLGDAGRRNLLAGSVWFVNNPTMQPHTKALFFGTCVISAIVVLIMWRTDETEPSYDGKPLSYYVGLNDRYYGGSASERKAAADAISHIGTNAISFLVKWIQYDEPAGITKFRETLGAKIGRNVFYSRRAHRANLTIHAFRALGPAVQQAISPLLKLATNSSTSDTIAARAIYALAWTGNTNALSPLMFCLTNTSAERRSSAAAALEDMGKTAEPLFRSSSSCCMITTQLLPDARLLRSAV